MMLASPTRGNTAMHPFFAPCTRGLEPVLADELQALGAHAVSTTAGGIGFAGPFELGYRANLESRIASRILWRVGQADYRNENDVYQAAYDLPWHDWFDPARTLVVKVSAQHCPLRSLDFITLKIKDAICDKFRALSGRRPSIDTRQPDIRIHAYLDAASLTLYLDTSGTALFQRGYRAAAGAAPLRENLAAGILRLAGWEPGIALCDPMCGSGTFLAEGAMGLDAAFGAAHDCSCLRHIHIFPITQQEGFPLTRRQAFQSLFNQSKSLGPLQKFRWPARS